jgi:hypothetical protein
MATRGGNLALFQLRGRPNGTLYLLLRPLGSYSPALSHLIAIRTESEHGRSASSPSHGYTLSESPVALSKLWRAFFTLAT